MAESRSNGKRSKSGMARLYPSRDSLESAGRWALRALFVVLGVGAIWGSLEVESRVRGDQRFFLETWALEAGELPDWVTPDIRDEILKVRLVGENGPLSLFQAGVLDRVRDTLASSPWIKEVPDIQIRYPTFENPGALTLSLHLRRPVALIEQAGFFYLADSTGMRLGPAYEKAPTEWFAVPAITSVPAPGPLPAPGERWASRDVSQGIEVAKILLEYGIARDFPDRPIQAIDLTNLHGRVAQRESEIVLWCGKQRLHWGRSPISTGPRTATTPEIVANLRRVLGNFDSFNHMTVIHLHRRPDTLTGIRG